MSHTPSTPSAAALDAALPQTQCTRCGYPRCREYAAALAQGMADLNRCPPGGEATIRELAKLLGRQIKALDPECGTHTPRVLAVIDEAVCIGCRKCLDVCPVDAIIGARKLMHTVLTAECNGCGLCVPPCPVDCIAMLPVTVTPDPHSLWPEYPCAETGRWRARTEARLTRLAQRTERRRKPHKPAAPSNEERTRMRAEIAAAVARVRARRNGSSS